MRRTQAWAHGKRRGNAISPDVTVASTRRQAPFGPRTSTVLGTYGALSLMVSIYLVGGIILSSLGIHGIYLGNVYNEVRNRPLYVVDETANFAAEEE